MQGSIFDSITTGNIDLLGGGIGNQGINGNQLAEIFGAQAQAEAYIDAQQRAERERRTKLLIISGSIVVTIGVLIAFYFMTKQKPKA